ncbi:M23 family metallopeptidase [Nonlabens marinus]|uniref:Peptidase, M23/M37 family n=1 Tax=Nonlabens marinus S1-08 TaxID=1454201 RepID=W8VWH3_9FLAO|nr:M23 family metallopeptidase [Nonlabens marinus]BAO54732.1 peptidase, M23/M37 family [Nonlabens marinus S1-08]
MVIAVLTYFLKPEYFDFIVKPSARQVYERELKKTPQDLEQWKSLKQLALKDSITTSESYSEFVQTRIESPFAAGYWVNVAQGESVFATIAIDTIKPSWILEAYDIQGKLIQTARVTDSSLALQIINDKHQRLQIVLQSFLEKRDSTQLKIYKQPLLDFPLPGKSNNAIKSFWGVARDGGRRSHEGNDIFADRGHPVVAAADGRISAVRDRGLGGKQIWLQDALTSSSHYYAHLDSQLVTTGQRVSRGDTIGLVGNTGNARTTASHLHFGIYKSGGAVDPKPYIWQIPIPENSTEMPFKSRGVGFGLSAFMHQQPSASSVSLRTIYEDTLQIIGNSNDWYHVRTADSLAGFAHKSVVRLIEINSSTH